MKQKFIISGIIVLALGALGSFLGGLLWSIFPMAGNTLPHHLEQWVGVSFHWAALQVSVLLGLLCVTAIALFAILQPPEKESKPER